MQRSWLVLLVLGAVVLAGCSAPDGSSHSDPADVSYPSGWNADGPDDVKAAIDQSAGAAGDGDFVERWVTVGQTETGMDKPYRVTETVVRLDRDRERLLRMKRFYLVDTDVAAEVTASGTAPIADRRADEVIGNYFDADGAIRYQRLGNRLPRTSRMDADFGSATDRQLPAALVGSAPVLESAAYSSPVSAGSSVRYAISNVSAFHIDNGSGRLVIGGDGVVSSYNITESTNDDHEAFRYSLEPVEVSVSGPEWADSAGSNTTSTG